MGKFLVAGCSVESVDVYRAAERCQQTRATRDYQEAIFWILLLIPIDALWIFGPECAQKIFRNFSALVLFRFPIRAAIQRDQPIIVGVRRSQREKEKPGAKVAHHFEHPRLNRCRPCQQHEMIIAGVSPLTVNTGVGFKSFAVQHPGQDAQRLYQIILLCAENGVKFSHDGRLKPDAWKKIDVAQFFAPNIGCVRHKRRCGEIVGGIG